MAKVLNPLFSHGASGKLGERLVFSQRASGQQARYQRIQKDVISSLRTAQRDLYISAVAGWNSLSAEAKADWNLLAKYENMTGYNLYIKQNIGAVIFDTDYQAILDFATIQGYTLPTAEQQAFQNDLMLGLKSSGAFDLLDYFHVPANDGSEEFGTLNWINPATFQLVNNSTVWTSNEGFYGAGSPQYLETNFVPSTDGVNYVQDSASFGYYALTKSVSVGYHGCSDGVQATIIQYPQGAGENYFGIYINNGEPNDNFEYASTKGLIIANRPNASNSELIFEGVVLDTNLHTSLGLPAQSLVYYALNVGGKVAFCDGKISITFAGASLSDVATAFNTAIQNYLTAIGAI